MTKELAELLGGYGVLSVVTAIAITWAVMKDRAIAALHLKVGLTQKEHNEKLEKLAEKHKDEMSTLEERYITKAESWMEKYHDLSKASLMLEEARQKQLTRRAGG